MTTSFHAHPAWYSDGLRWIGSLFSDAADALDRNRAAVAQPLEPVPRGQTVDEFLVDARYRLLDRI